MVRGRDELVVMVVVERRLRWRWWGRRRRRRHVVGEGGRRWWSYRCRPVVRVRVRVRHGCTGVGRVRVDGGNV